MLRSGFVSYFKEVRRARGHLLSKLLKALPEGTKYLLVEHIEVSTVQAWSDVPPL